MNWTKITKNSKTWPPVKEKILITYLKDYGVPWGVERIFEIAERQKGNEFDFPYPLLNSVVIRDDVTVHWQPLIFNEGEA